MKPFLPLPPSIHNVHWNMNILSDTQKLEDKPKESYFTTELFSSTNQSVIPVQTHQKAELLVVPLGTRAAKGLQVLQITLPVHPFAGQTSSERSSVLRRFSSSKQG